MLIGVAYRRSLTCPSIVCGEYLMLAWYTYMLRRSESRFFSEKPKDRLTQLRLILDQFVWFLLFPKKGKEEEFFIWFNLPLSTSSVQHAYINCISRKAVEKVLAHKLYSMTIFPYVEGVCKRNGLQWTSNQ